MSEDNEDVLTESGEVEKAPDRRPKRAVSFSRPPYAKEVLTDDGEANFNKLPGWQRHLIKRIVDHGDLRRAAREAGVSAYVNKTVDIDSGEKKTIAQALNEGGLTNDLLVSHLKECMEANTIKFDKHQNPLNVTDLALRLKTIELVLKLKGAFQEAMNKTAPTQPAEELFEDTDLSGK